MDCLLARDLEGKSVIGTDGTTFGTLADITMNVDSGALRTLVVTPYNQRASSNDETHRQLLIPVNRIESIAERIVVYTERYERWDGQ